MWNAYIQKNAQQQVYTYTENTQFLTEFDYLIKLFCVPQKINSRTRFL